ncbi:hypothetical protein GY45DRAFT_1376363 [Cubamyces sp. BRFM 1775]|nr:hypothetical protein GY45DRAFT_1376363 [Cubamyces sp. BRFM 1775]
MSQTSQTASQPSRPALATPPGPETPSEGRTEGTTARSSPSTGGLGVPTEYLARYMHLPSIGVAGGQGSSQLNPVQMPEQEAPPRGLADTQALLSLAGLLNNQGGAGAPRLPTGSKQGIPLDIHPLLAGANPGGLLGQSSAVPNRLGMLGPLHINPQVLHVQGNHPATESTAQPKGTADIHEELHALRAEVSELRAQLAAIHTNTDAGTSQHRLQGQVPAEITRAVHIETRHLLDLVEKRSRGRGKGTYVLPEPLGVGAEPRFKPDGTRLYNPDWHLDIDEGANPEAIQAIVNLVLSKTSDHGIVGGSNPETRALVKRAACNYFRTLKRQYESENDEEVKKKRQKKHVSDRRNGRSTHKAMELRLGIKPLQLAFGAENTEGVEEVIHSPWQSEEVSTEDEAKHAARMEMRKAAQVSPRAFEVRSKVWKSSKLMRIYFVLAVFSRFQRMHADVVQQKPPEGEGEDAARQLAEWCAAFIQRVVDAVKGWKSVLDTPWQNRDRFRGPSANYSDKLPKEGKKRRKLYKECVSRRWASQSTENLLVYSELPSCPDHFTIFDMDFPDELIPEKDRVWLQGLGDSGDEADNEDEAEEEAV